MGVLHFLNVDVTTQGAVHACVTVVMDFDVILTPNVFLTIHVKKHRRYVDRELRVFTLNQENSNVNVMWATMQQKKAQTTHHSAIELIIARVSRIHVPTNKFVSLQVLWNTIAFLVKIQKTSM